MPITIRNGEHLTSARIRAVRGTRGSMSAIPLWFWATAAAVFGMVMGSFFSVLTYRWPREESLATPRSHCTACAHHCAGTRTSRCCRWLALAAGAVRAVPPSRGATPRSSCERRPRCRRDRRVRSEWRGLAVLVMALALVPVVVIDLEHNSSRTSWSCPPRRSRWSSRCSTIRAAVGPGRRRRRRSRVPRCPVARLPARNGLRRRQARAPSRCRPRRFRHPGAGDLVLRRVGHRRHADRPSRAWRAQDRGPFGPFLAAGALIALWAGPTLITWYTDRLG